MSAEQHPELPAPTGQPPLWQVVNLLDVRLLRLQAETRADDALDQSAPTLLQLDYRARARDLSAQNQVEVEVTLRVFTDESNAEGAPPASPLLAIEGTWRVLYSRPAGHLASEEELREFAERNGVFNVWPYWRELTHSLYGRMGLAIPPLPVFRVDGGPHLADGPTSP